MFTIEKRIQKSVINTCIINSIISEFDIKQAGISAYTKATGDTVTYKDLMKLDKKNRNIKLGLMIRDNPSIQTKINEVIKGWLNEFIKLNKIKETNFIECNNDSITVCNTIVEHLIIDEYCEFVNKEGDFSTMIRLSEVNKNLVILYDNMFRNIKIKGVGEEYVKSSVFVKKYMIPFMASLENGVMDCFKTKQLVRENYIKDTDVNVYRELFNKNLLMYRDEENNRTIESEVIIKDLDVIKDDNYIKFIFPLLRLKMI